MLDDVRNLDISKHGRFDVVLCAGFLYQPQPSEEYVVEALRLSLESDKRHTIVPHHIFLAAVRPIALKYDFVIGQGQHA